MRFIKQLAVSSSQLNNNHFMFDIMFLIICVVEHPIINFLYLKRVFKYSMYVMGEVKGQHKLRCL